MDIIIVHIAMPAYQLHLIARVMIIGIIVYNVLRTLCLKMEYVWLILLGMCLGPLEPVDPDIAKEMETAIKMIINLQM